MTHPRFHMISIHATAPRTPLMRLFLIVLLFAAASTPGASRFQRVVRAYKSYKQINENRDITLDITRLASPGARTVDSETLDTTYRYRNGISTNLRFVLDHQRSTNLTERGDRSTVEFNFLHRTSGYSFRGYKRPGFDTICAGTICIPVQYGQQVNDTDTVTVASSLVAQKCWHYTAYPLARSPLSPFVHATGAVRAAGLYEDQENLEPYIPDSFMTHKYYRSTRAVAVEADIEAGIGLGRLMNVSHVYHAFELEEQLIKLGVIRFPLSDETLLALTALLARYDSYRLRDHAVFKKFKQELDTAIVRDAAGERSRLRTLSQFDLRRLLLRGEPDFMRGTRLSLIAKQSLGASLQQTELHYPFDGIHRFRDTLRTDIPFKHTLVMVLALTQGISLTPRWFLDVSCRKCLASGEDGIVFYKDRHVDMDKALETGWFLRSSYWAASRLLVQAGADNIPTDIVVPRHWPYHSWLSAYVLLEDYIGVRVTFSLYNAQAAILQHGYRPPYVHNGPAASAAVTYGF